MGRVGPWCCRGDSMPMVLLSLWHVRVCILSTPKWAGQCPDTSEHRSLKKKRAILGSQLWKLPGCECGRNECHGCTSPFSLQGFPPSLSMFCSPSVALLKAPSSWKLP